MQTNQEKSPTQNNHPTKSPIHSSILKQPIPLEKQMSPIQLKNKYEPLLKNNKTNSNSATSLGSSSCSGPIFPPGFEHFVPVHTRIEKERKRRKKMEKKRKLKREVSNAQKAESLSSPSKKVSSIHIDDVIKMAESIGVTFNGSVSELKKRIVSILNEQTQNWEANS